MAMDGVELCKCLGDETRLLIAGLILHEGELCVCELTEALDQSQPKISRHLARLRSGGLLCDERHGQWVYYNLNPTLPDWALSALQAAIEGNADRLAEARARLQAMGNRPDRRAALC